MLYVCCMAVFKGSVLGPTLFNLFLMTFQEYWRLILTCTCMRRQWRSLYTIHSPHTKLYKKHINYFLNWCTQWHVKLNEQKTAATFFYRKLTYPNRIIVIMLPFLGLTILNIWELSWTEDLLGKNISPIFEVKGTWISKSISPLLKSVTLYIKNKLILYNAYIWSILTYACPI